MGITSEKIELKNVRLSFADIYKAKAFEVGQKPRYSASFLLDPSDKAHKKLIKLIKSEGDRIAEEEWGFTVDQMLERSNKKNKEVPKLKGTCFGNGDDLDKVYDGYDDMFFVRTSKLEDDGRPTVVDTDMSPLTAEDNKPYNGCYVDATLTLWTQNNQYGKRINGNLRAIRFRSDGDAFGRPPIEAEDEFSEVPEDDGDFLDD